MATLDDMAAGPPPAAKTFSLDDMAAGPPPAGAASAEPMSWGDVASKAASNLGPSAQRFGSDIVGAVTHPLDTLEGLKNVALGAGEKAVSAGSNAITGHGLDLPHEKYADAVGQFFANRYGGIDKVKQTIAQDPVGFASDVASILTGGELAAARLPGIAGKVGEIAGNVGRAVDPINAATNVVKAVGKGAGKVATEGLGLTTGVGGIPIAEAARAGYEGGTAGQAFRDSMRGNVPMEDVIGDAKTALQSIKNDRQAAYTAGMADLSKDSTVLDFSKIDSAMAPVRAVKTFQGPTSGISVSLQPSTAKVAQKIDDVLNQWRDLPPEDFHTATGFDALKQRIGDIADKTKPGSAGQKVATQAYNIVKNQIVAQAPDYAKTMAGYQNASDLIRQMESSLSLGRSAMADTTLRKLQSVMRDNVSTNYGQRAALVKMLQDAGATHIMRQLAGQSLSAFAPRGIVRAVAGGADAGALGALILHPELLLHPATWGAALAGLTVQSPRVVGEAAHLAGRVAGATKPITKVLPAVRPALQGAFQAGRTNRASQ